MRIVLDSGAVSFLAGRTSRVATVFDHLTGLGDLAVPTPVLVECLTGRPSDATTYRFLQACEIIEHVPAVIAYRAALLRFQAGRGSAVDALVVAFAEDGAVVTGDTKDISALIAYANNVAMVSI